MDDLGTKFKAPRKDDLKQWKNVKLLFDGGFRFNGYAKTPDSPRQVKAFLDAYWSAALREPRHPHRSTRSRRKPDRNRNVVNGQRS